MSGSHYLFNLIQLDIDDDSSSNGGFSIQRDRFKWKAQIDSKGIHSNLVDVTNYKGTDGPIDGIKPGGNYFTAGPQFNNTPLKINGVNYTARNIKYDNVGNEAPFYAAGGTGSYWVTFGGGARKFISNVPDASGESANPTLVFVRPASGGKEKLLVEFPKTFAERLEAEIAVNGQPTQIEVGFVNENNNNVGLFHNNKIYGALLAPAGLNGAGGSQVSCYCTGTMICTMNGEVPVEKLQVGDMVMTSDCGFQPIRWIGSRRLSKSEMVENPKLYPICITEGALGQDQPQRDLHISPQHRVRIRSNSANEMFDCDEVLVPAKDLLDLDGVERVERVKLYDEIEYFHIMFDQHQVIFAEGMGSESLYAGPQALQMIGRGARDELFSLFPELEHMNAEGIKPEPARMLVSGQPARKMVRDHHMRSGKDRTAPPGAEGAPRHIDTKSHRIKSGRHFDDQSIGAKK